MTASGKPPAFRKLRRFLGAEGGATAIEYAFLLCLIASVLIAGLTMVGGSAKDYFDGFAGKF